MTRKKSQTKKNRNSRNSNTLRIIGGEWRSRKLPFVDAPGLRPTPDRVRETLFNWLQGNIHGATCIDMFAGSGALGFEALSRGAKDVLFIEKNSSCVTQLRENLKLLDNKADVLHNDALNFLSAINKPKKPYDIVFLDPPYRQGLIEKSLTYLNTEDLIDKDTLLYIEHESEEQINWDDYNLNVLKQTNAGQVLSFLLASK